MHRRLIAVCIALFSAQVAFAQSRAYLAGISGRVEVGSDGTWVFLTLDPSRAFRSVMINAIGPGLIPYGVTGTISDPQFEIWDQSGTKIAGNNDHVSSLESDPAYPSFARDPKDAALRLSLAPGVYAMHVTGVGGATGVCFINIDDDGAFPGVSSIAVLGSEANSGTAFGANLWGAGNISFASFLSGPNLPVAPPMADPEFSVWAGATTFLSVSGIGGGVPDAMPRYHSPVIGDSHNAGEVFLYTYNTGDPSTATPPVFTLPAAAGTFLFELHSQDFTAVRPAVTYVVPPDTTVDEGGTLTLRALVGGEVDSAIWQRNGVDIPGSAAVVTSSAMTLTLAQPNMALGGGGTYRLHMTTVGGATVYSPPTTVTVQQVPVSILGQPESVTVPTGASTTLAVTATGSGLTYQWYKDGLAIAGATSSTFTLSAATAADAGSYTVAVAGSLGMVTSSAAVVTVQPITRLTNLSVRAFSGAGDRVLIVGYGLEGAGKPLIVRAVGPSLSAFGVTDFMPDPRLGVYLGTTGIYANDDWAGDDGRALGAFALPAGSKDAVVRNNFEGQSYTAQVDAKGGANGEVLVELYDADPESTSTRLINVSSRTQVDDGQRLIFGMTLTGVNAKGLVMRAVGPGLGSFGVAAAHPDPRMELYDTSTQIIAANDDWSGDDGNASGAFPLQPGSKDAVLVRTLSPGSYTLHVLGAPGTSGVVLVEVYEQR